MKIIEKIRYILLADREVSRFNHDREWKNQATITWVGIIGSGIMSLLNVMQHSTAMLYFTGGTSLVLLLSYLLSLRGRRTIVLRMVFTLIFVVVFTIYVLKGGNDGFAALWLILAPYVLLGMVDLKIGFCACTYYLIMLLLCMKGPLAFLRQFEYTPMFLTRFPVLYAINFAFALIFAVRLRQSQYEILKRQEELEQISVIDVSTGLGNRNGYNLYISESGTIKPERMSAIYIDVNGLHEVNNRFGHEAGDKMLRCIASLCRDIFAGENVFRVGGDEFVILSEHLTEQEMREKMDLVLADIAREGYSLAYGLACGQVGMSVEELVREADHRMLENKRRYYSTNEHDRRKER